MPEGVAFVDEGRERLFREPLLLRAAQRVTDTVERVPTEPVERPHLETGGHEDRLEERQGLGE
jgi:hypothetical protein